MQWLGKRNESILKFTKLNKHNNLVQIKLIFDALLKYYGLISRLTTQLHSFQMLKNATV